MPVFVLCLLSVSGLVLFFVGPTARETADAVARAVAEGDVVQGGISAHFDAEVERSHPYRDVAMPVIAALRYLILRQGSSGVVVGREGWLFSDEELQHHPGDAGRLRNRLQYVHDVAAYLDEVYGAHLAIVIVPSKARIAAARVPSYLRPTTAHERLRRAVEGLAASNMTVINAAEQISPKEFFRRDTHWRPGGAAKVAQALTTAIPEFNGFGTEYQLQHKPEETLPGDLLSFVPVGRWSDHLGLTAERFRPVEAVLGEDPSEGGGLFDTPEIPIALVGTSYSADQRFGFQAALQHALRGDVLNVAEPAGGPFGPMEAYLHGETIGEIPPQLVVWEIPERYLTIPTIGTPESPKR
ncbi:MAG: alginate O-acetyltransferase AlgX-related protein [Alkalispirochaeta sp.]